MNEIHLRSPKTKVLLLGIFPRGATVEDEKRQRNAEINQLIKNLDDQKRVWFLDIGDHFLDENGVLPKSVMADLLHPGESGYRIWAEAMEPLLARLLGE